MEEILKAILQGAANSQRQQPQQPQGGAEQIADLIGGILGARQPQQPQARPQQQSGGGLQDLIGSILGGAQQQQPRRQVPQQPQDNGFGLDDVLGAILGSSQRQGTGQGGGLSDLIGMVLGGGSGGSQQINPIAQMISSKFGIPPQIAQMAVAYFISHFLTKKMNEMRGGGQAQQMPDEYDIGRAKPRGQEMDLDDLLDMEDDEESLQGNLDDMGMIGDIARMTGLDKSTAGKALGEIVKILGSKRRRPEPVIPSRPQGNGNLEDLLESW